VNCDRVFFLFLGLILQAFRSVFKLRHLNPFVLGNRNPGLFSFPNAEDIIRPCCKGIASLVSDMHNIMRSWVLFLVDNDPYTPCIVTTRRHADVACLKGNRLFDLLRLEVDLHCVVQLDFGVREADGAAVMGDEVGDALGAQRHPGDFA